jgi:DNA primase
MTNEQRNRLRRRIPLLTYLQQQGWKPLAYGESDEAYGRCPLHFESRPSFYVNRRKDVFYCHGCGQGGDVIRLAQLLHGYSFVEALAELLPANAGAEGLWEAACGFYENCLEQYDEARDYLHCRGIHDVHIIERMHIGYAPGGCLRAHLEDLGYSRQAIVASGLTGMDGRDRMWRSIVFPLEQNESMYGRHIGCDRVRHRFLARPKGGLYGWKWAREFPQVIVVEGLFDVASLWQAGYPNTVAILGSHLNPVQYLQLSTDKPEAVYLCLDADHNGSGQRAAAMSCQQLQAAGLRVLRVRLPHGYDPNRFFAEGGQASQFEKYLQEAEP